MGYLQHKGYEGSVEYSEEDQCLYGKVLGLKNSLILYEGNSLDELKEDFKDGVECYLDRCNSKGSEPEKPHKYNGLFDDIHIPVEIHSRIAMYAKKHGTSIDDFVCDSIERRLEVVN